MSLRLRSRKRSSRRWSKRSSRRKSFGKSELRPEEAFKLGRICQLLTDNPKAKIVIKGFADSGTGTSEINNRLARERAQAVASMLQSGGIDASRISVESLGADRNASASPESNRVAVCIVE